MKITESVPAMLRAERILFDVYENLVKGTTYTGRDSEADWKALRKLLNEYDDGKEPSEMAPSPKV